MNSIKKQARVAGLLYLLGGITAPFSLIHVPRTLVLRMHRQGLSVAAIFWGLWLFPFGVLVIRSGFIPRVLGVLLIIAGSGYVASSFTSLVLPQYADMVSQLATVLEFGELPILFWLLIWGAKVKPSDAPAS